jgi:Flp pilus assembly protein TadG
MGTVKQNVAARIQSCSLPAGQPTFRIEAPTTTHEAVFNVATGIRRTPRRTRPAAHQRRGVVTLWMIVALPVLMLLLILLIEIGNIWRARVELENALEAAALAAVKEWGNGASNSDARDVGVAYAAANTVTGSPVVITDNDSGAPADNGNALPNGNLVLGAVTTTTIPWVFHSGTTPSCSAPATDFGVRAQATVRVNSVALRLGGYVVPMLYVSAAATARYSCTTSRPELIRVRPENFF